MKAEVLVFFSAIFADLKILRAMYIQQLYTNCLAEAAYYIESNGEAAIIDPLRETEPYLDLALLRGARIKYVFETHFHADFVSGHIDLARQSGASIVYGPTAKPNYAIVEATDGQEFPLGELTIKVLHTPGHTPESSCFLLLDKHGNPHAVFTGDTLFVGDVGRPDLLDGVMSKETLAGMLYDSLQGKIKTLPDAVIVYPGHGAGSACGKNIGKETFSTIGEQKKLNYALQDMSREEFIRKVTDGILPPPKYFFEDARINKQGYAPIDDVMEVNSRPLSAEAFTAAMNEDVLILDTREAEEFAKGFIPGSVNVGLNGQFAVWVGTLIPIHQRLLLVTAPGKERESVLRLARVGYENILGYLDKGVDAWPGALDSVQTAEAADLLTGKFDEAEFLDVRRPGEWSAGHWKDARFTPLSEMPANTLSLDKSRTYVVYCGGGYRSMTAISLMKRQGFGNLVNAAGGVTAMTKAGVRLVSEEVVA
jgi:glyoxylase-like metal-dependent hydrolase (beta-lactamase superfamily II)/rhodanese-related sulfurtransferase